VLIDDDEIDNAHHERILKKSGFVDEVMIFQYADEALDFLRTGEVKHRAIFLDINMPRMNGFEFLEEYKNLPEERKALAVIMMLTTSTNPSDHERALEYSPSINYQSKPLTIEVVNELAELHF
jgi:CheY-like chemotaxis protein